MSWPGKLILPAVFLLAACTTVTPRPDRGPDAVDVALSEAAAVNSVAVIPPPEVRDALLPVVSALPAPRPVVERFNVDVTASPAKAFFMSLVAGTEHSIVVHPGVTGTISLAMKNTTVQYVLDTVRTVYGFDYERRPGGWIILPATLRTRIFQVDYLNLQRSGASRTRISSGQLSQNGSDSGNTGNTGEGQSTTTAAESGTQLAGSQIDTLYANDFWQELKDTLGALVGTADGSRVIVNSQNGVIVVRAMPAELHSVDQYLRTVQTNAHRQVILEAKIIEVELNDSYQAGINWAAVANTASGDSLFAGQVTPDQPFTTDFDDLGVSPITVGPGAVTRAVETATLGGAFALALDLGDFNAFIDLLQIQGETRVLSSPRVATLNNQKAVIKAGTDEFFVTDISSNTVTGTASATSRDVELTPFFSGIALDVTPQISADGMVTLHVHPTVSEVVDQRKDLTVSGETDRLPLAFSQIRESDSIVRARSGQVVVIGGLMRDISRDERYGTPGLSQLPGIGAFFRSKRRVSRKTELVILLRPMVVDQDEVWAQAARESHDRIRDY